MDKNTILSPTKKRLMEFIGKRYPLTNDGERAEIANDMVRFVKVIQRVYTEPQPKVTMSYRETDSGKEKDTHISTTMDEFEKLWVKPDGSGNMELGAAMRRLHEIATRTRRRSGKRKN